MLLAAGATAEKQQSAADRSAALRLVESPRTSSVSTPAAWLLLR
jgi:hypothetical protein